MKKRVLSIILAILMIAALLPMAALADPADPVAKVGSTEYTDITEAVNAWVATNNSTLTLLADVTLTDVIKLNSTEMHTLNLSTFTMTAANNQNAIQIVPKGRTSASYALDIKADAENPGTISAPGKACVYSYNTSSSDHPKDRPIIRIYGGNFEGAYCIQHSSTNGTNCPQFYVYGGTFTATSYSIYTNRAVVQISGGKFNTKMMISPDSSAYTLITAGEFVDLGNNMGSSLNSDKWTFGTSKGTFNSDAYINEDGNYEIVKGIIPEADIPVNFDAELQYSPTGKGATLKYSNLQTSQSMKYEDGDLAVNAWSSGKELTVYGEVEADKNITSGNYSMKLVGENASYTGTLTASNSANLNLTGDGFTGTANMTGSGTLTVTPDESFSGNIVSSGSGAVTVNGNLGEDAFIVSSGSGEIKVTGELAGTAELNGAAKLVVPEGASVTGTIVVNSNDAVIDIDETVETKAVEIVVGTGVEIELPEGFGGTVKDVNGNEIERNENGGYEAVAFAQIGDAKFLTLADAIAAAQDGDVVTALTNCSIDSVLEVKADNVTIQGATKDITVTGLGTAGWSGFDVTGDNVTFKDITIKSCRTNNAYKAAIYFTRQGADSVMTLDGCTISDTFRCVEVGDNIGDNGKLVVKGCDLDATYPIHVGTGKIDIEVSDSALHGWTSYGAQTKSASFTDCEFSMGASGYDNVASYANTKFDGCEFDESFDLYAQTTGYQWKIVGCTKNGTPVTAENMATLGFSDSDVWNKCLVTVDDIPIIHSDLALDAGVTYNTDPTAWYDTDVVVTENNGTFSVVEAVAKIGDSKYATLEEAIAAAQSGDTVKLLKDSEADVILPVGVILDTNGKNYSGIVSAPAGYEPKNNGDGTWCVVTVEQALAEAKEAAVATFESYVAKLKLNDNSFMQAEIDKINAAADKAAVAEALAAAKARADGQKQAEIEAAAQALADAKTAAIAQLEAVVGDNDKQSVKDMLQSYIDQINAATSISAVNSIVPGATSALKQQLEIAAEGTLVSAIRNFVNAVDRNNQVTTSKVMGIIKPILGIFGIR